MKITANINVPTGKVSASIAGSPLATCESGFDPSVTEDFKTPITINFAVNPALEQRVTDLENENFVLTLNRDWVYYANKIKYTELTGTIPTGQVLTGEIGGGVVYRFISTAQTGLYPSEDSFYLTFDGTTLSDLITTR